MAHQDDLLMNGERCMWGFVGTREVVYASEYELKFGRIRVSSGDTSIPFVKMLDAYACPSDAYVVSPEGKWVIDSALRYDVLRKIEIEKTIPLDKQLEAITEAIWELIKVTEIDLEKVKKFAELANTITTIKAKYPK